VNVENVHYESDIAVYFFGVRERRKNSNTNSTKFRPLSRFERVSSKRLNRLNGLYNLYLSIV
jgi:hypothetical protein